MGSSLCALPESVEAEPEPGGVAFGMPYQEARSVIPSANWQPSVFKKTILGEIDRDLQEWFVTAGFIEASGLDHLS